MKIIAITNTNEPDATPAFTETFYWYQTDQVCQTVSNVQQATRYSEEDAQAKKTELEGFYSFGGPVTTISIQDPPA